jgi:hypothetical protein
MMEAASTTETSVDFYKTTRRSNPEGGHLQILFGNNLLRFRTHATLSNDSHRKVVNPETYILHTGRIIRYKMDSVLNQLIEV